MMNKIDSLICAALALLMLVTGGMNTPAAETAKAKAKSGVTAAKAGTKKSNADAAARAKAAAKAKMLARPGVVLLKPEGRIAFAPINESSGLARSRRHPGVYWTHNDSGDSARIFAIRRDGSLVLPQGIKPEIYQGIEVKGATNIDWEDIAVDGEGHLIIADCGNNGNKRRNLAIYIVREPDPERDTTATVLKKLPVYYPEQQFTENEPQNYDSEAVFVADGHIHILTKQRGNTHTRLYRLDTDYGDRLNALKLVGEFDAGGMVTAADTTPDGRRLAVLTYGDIWLFESPGAGDWFHGQIRRLPIFAGQCEAICFDGADNSKLLIGNEGRGLFSVPVKDLKPWPAEPGAKGSKPEGGPES